MYTHLLQGVDNVYTQHTPLLTATLTALSTDKMEVSQYPFMAATQVCVCVCASCAVPCHGRDTGGAFCNRP